MYINLNRELTDREEANKWQIADLVGCTAQQCEIGRMYGFISLYTV